MSAGVLGRVLLAGSLGGLSAGIVLTGVQMIEVLPIILDAEAYEQSAAQAGQAMHGGAATHVSFRPDSHPGGEPWRPEDGLERIAWTAVTNVAASIGLGLALCGCFALRGRVDTREGALWGLGGLAAFFIGPALSLPPELPGAAGGELLHRQLWWLFAVACSGGGLALIVFRREGVAALGGAGLILLPHVVGAPIGSESDRAAPISLLHEFASASLVANGVYWVLLGTLCAFFSGEASAAVRLREPGAPDERR